MRVALASSVEPVIILPSKRYGDDGMEFFETSFLATLPETLSSVSALALNNFAIFAVAAIAALELSRRITRYGLPLALLVILGAAAYATGVTTYFAK